MEKITTYECFWSLWTKEALERFESVLEKCSVQYTFTETGDGRTIDNLGREWKLSRLPTKPKDPV